MQQLEESNTYTPTDIPHIRSNCGLSFNREETLSVSGLKTSFNNSDAALTGLGDGSRMGLASSHYKNHLNLLTTEHEPVIVKTGYHLLGRGTLLHTLKSVVSATPAPDNI